MNKEESFKKGEIFEDYILEHIFKKENFILKEKTPNHCHSHFPENALNPDFKIECRKTNTIFWIEAKFRNNENIKKISVNKVQLDRYKTSKEKIYYLIGLGKNPKNPQYLCLVNCGRINNEIPLKIFHRYRIDVKKIKNFNELLELTSKSHT
ncbi:hypothetical protein [Flavivirga sp. 57AJ16]|uniref:hypothetical protein n=1 Tax=Flavivirga sp. 57AJ16 TaxID=3025307 RepID=UPI002365EFD3|nr:hypothetical protein [Flavivirga sp. 57AJ16]MDD7885747.1 hypothetical protein [Flavivirga sp. 57AJ16]